MKRYTLLCAIAMTAPLAAAADGPLGSEIYGRINISLDSVEQDIDLAPQDEADEWQLNSNASRIGLKGEMELSPGLSAIYQMEWQVNIDGDGSDLSARNRFLGLRGEYGTILAGRHDTPTKLAQNDIDLFNDLTGDIGSTFEGENRVSDIVLYHSPKLGPWSASLAFIPGEDDADQGSSDLVTGDGVADGISFAAQYSTSRFLVALGIDRDVDGQDLERLVAQYELGDFTFGGMLQQNENDAGTIDEQGALISLAYTVQQNVFKVQLGMLENDANGREKETFSLGYDRILGKSTKAYSYITRNVDSDEPGNEAQDTVFGVGMQHKF